MCGLPVVVHASAAVIGAWDAPTEEGVDGHPPQVDGSRAPNHQRPLPLLPSKTKGARFDNLAPPNIYDWMRNRTTL